MTCGDFRIRYEEEVLPGLADKTAQVAGTVFNRVEDVIARKLLRQVDANAISTLCKALRSRPVSESTIKAYPCHICGLLSTGACV